MVFENSVHCIVPFLQPIASGDSACELMAWQQPCVRISCNDRRELITDVPCNGPSLSNTGLVAFRVFAIFCHIKGTFREKNPCYPNGMASTLSEWPLFLGFARTFRGKPGKSLANTKNNKTNSYRG